MDQQTGVSSGNERRVNLSTGTRKRLSGEDSFLAKEFLKQAVFLIEPANRTQRQMVQELMPELFVLRKKGFSFEQMSQLLSEVKITLQPGTLRSYYADFIVDRMSQCEERFDEQLLLLSQVKKGMQNVGVDDLTAKLVSNMKANLENAQPKINNGLAASGARLSSATEIEGSDMGNVEVAGTARTAPGTPAPREAMQSPRAETPAADEEDGFSLLNVKPATGKSAPAKHDFLDDEPGIPQLTTPAGSATAPAPVVSKPAKPTASPAVATPVHSPASEAAGSSSPILKCRPLQPGFKPLPRKDGVPEAVYQEGLLEHPAIPGLMLTLDERLYGSFLEIVNTTDGETRQEEIREKSLRALWRKKATTSTGSTAGDFTEMNLDIFAKNHR